MNIYLFEYIFIHNRLFEVNQRLSEIWKKNILTGCTGFLESAINEMEHMEESITHKLRGILKKPIDFQMTKHRTIKFLKLLYKSFFTERSLPQPCTNIIV